MQRLVVKVRKSPKVPERENGVVERRQRVAPPNSDRLEQRAYSHRDMQGRNQY